MKPNLLEMVIPIHCAAYLKMKGVKQQSLFYWVVDENGETELHANTLKPEGEYPDKPMPDNFYAAFLTDELVLALKNCPDLGTNLIKMHFNIKHYETYPYVLDNKFSIGTMIVEIMEHIEDEERQERKEREEMEKQKNENLLCRRAKKDRIKYKPNGKQK